MDEDDQMVIREAGEQRHPSLSSTLGTRGVDKVSVYGDASVAAHGVTCTPLIPWSSLLALVSSVLTTEPFSMFR